MTGGAVTGSAVQEIAPGIWGWDRRPRGLRAGEFGTRTSYAVVVDGETLLVDPLVDGVARLTEMCADAAAARRSGRATLVSALLAMGIAAAGAARRAGRHRLATTARVHRLLEPPRRGRRARYAAALMTVTLLLAVISAFVTMFAGSLAAHGLTGG